MNSFIKGIAIFRDATKEGRRILELSRGLNIIAGNSKTGKSAILDIIDWCLGAKDSTIPIGVITKFANLYVLLIEFNGVSLLLARENGKKGENYLHVITVSKDLTIKEVKFNDILTENFFKVGIALERINEVIDLGLGDNKILDLDYKIPNVTLRSAIAFNFQHQDIISSNSRLFYIDPIKNHFPILAGWFNSNYYVVLSTIEKIQKDINRIAKQNENARKENCKLENNFKNSLRIYYNLIGVDFNNNWSVEDYLKRIKNLEEFKKEEFSNNLVKRQEELGAQIDKYQSEIIQMNRQLSVLNAQTKKGSEYKLLLDRYKERGKYIQIQPDYFCPICNKSNEHLSFEALSILEAEDELKNELLQIPSQANKFDIDIQELNSKKKALITLVNNLKVESQQNEKILVNIAKEKNLNEQKQKARWKVISDAEIYNDRHVPVKEKTIDELNAQLSILLEKKRTYNENERYEKAKIEIEDKMSLIVELLDFEHKPPQLFFEINPQKADSYKLYHNNTGEERTFLRQIGSASNALACHIGLFLSFLNFFCRQKFSKVPSILFFDQPSQVYFPSGTDNNDIEKVGQIYETILNEIENIEQETGIIPQIIVADHIKDLGEETVKLYGHYFKADWRDGSGLI